MKVLLVEPPKKTWGVMGDYIAPPLGLAQLAAVLEKESIPVDIVDCLDRGGDPSAVNGIAFRNGNEITLTPGQPLVDVNALPLPAYHLLPMDRYRFTILEKYATVHRQEMLPDIRKK